MAGSQGSRTSRKSCASTSTRPRTRTTSYQVGMLLKLSWANTPVFHLDFPRRDKLPVDLTHLEAAGIGGPGSQARHSVASMARHLLLETLQHRDWPPGRRSWHTWSSTCRGMQARSWTLGSHSRLFSTTSRYGRFKHIQQSTRMSICLSYRRASLVFPSTKTARVACELRVEDGHRKHHWLLSASHPPTLTEGLKEADTETPIRAASHRE